MAAVRWLKHTFLYASPEDTERCKANRLFRCDLCYSTLMLRRDFYKKSAEI